ncbi:MAG: MBOAT family protein, partial [Verrucomicrobiota bacterium]
LHFGLLDLLAWGWNRAGFAVRPLMDAPWKARTLGEFWGLRWNRGFSEVNRWAIYRPIAKVAGAPVALLAGFLFSGVIHDLVVSVPAGAGYGWPTAYFLAQGGAVLAEKRWNLRGRCWVAALVGGPVLFLFHPGFLTDVMAPHFELLP